MHRSTTRPTMALAGAPSLGSAPRKPLYTPEQRLRRDASRWTLVQGLLAPIQFLVFLVSLGLVLRYLFTGEGLSAATFSVIVKTLTLYTIMVTGCIWEKVVFDKWLFAEAFFWEDVFSMLVLALAAYATYIVNAGQFLWKLRMARLDAERTDAAARARTAALGAVS